MCARRHLNWSHVKSPDPRTHLSHTSTMPLSCRAAVKAWSHRGTVNSVEPGCAYNDLYSRYNNGSKKEKWRQNIVEQEGKRLEWIASTVSTSTLYIYYTDPVGVNV